MYKASQWVLISRSHAIELVRLARQLEQQQLSGQQQQHHHQHQQQQQHQTHQATSSSSLSSPPSSSSPSFCEFNEIFKPFVKVSASDEMFFPTYLSYLGYLVDNNKDDRGIINSISRDDRKRGGNNVSMVDIRNQNNTNIITTTTTSSTTPPTTTNTTSPSVICKHITYCDWSNSTKNPHTFLINSTNNFPTSIAITAKYKGKMIFLRKIKFPLHDNNNDKNNDNNNYSKKYNHQEHSRNSEMTTNNDDHKVLNEVQISFLKEWLSCLLSDEISNKSNNDDDEDSNDYRSNRMKKEVRIVAANNNEVNNLSRWIQLANKILYCQSKNDRYSNYNNVDDDDAVVAASSVSGRRYDDNHYRDDRCNNTDYNDNMMKKKRKHQ